MGLAIAPKRPSLVGISTLKAGRGMPHAATTGCDEEAIPQGTVRSGWRRSNRAGGDPTGNRKKRSWGAHACIPALKVKATPMTSVSCAAGTESSGCAVARGAETTHGDAHTGAIIRH